MVTPTKNFEKRGQLTYPLYSSAVLSERQRV